MQINRLFEIVYTLLQKNKVSAAELAQQLEVSRRTICRDIDILSGAGIPIYTEKGKGGGISLLPDFVLSKSILTEQEQHEILSALHGLSNIKKNETVQVLQKMSAVFNKTAQNWMEVDFSDWHCENDFFGDLKTAILQRHIIEFDYYNSYGEKTSRRVQPIQLWFKSKSWYLKGFCLTKHAERLYKLARVKSLKVTGEHFTPQNIAAQLDNRQKNRDVQQEVTLKLRIEQQMAYRVYDDFGENEVDKQKDGSFLITVTFPEDNWVYSFLLSYGQHVEVLGPESIREFLKNEAENILRKYL
ncbi:MAG: YafY family transcriptional regulator [Firmicutes bacterium]|nr:YafY family transcriptional regulator [Bacillota bacterium]